MRLEIVRTAIVAIASTATLPPESERCLIAILTAPDLGIHANRDEKASSSKEETWYRTDEGDDNGIVPEDAQAIPSENTNEHDHESGYSDLFTGFRNKT